MTSRSSRFLWGVGFSYLNFGIVTVIGLWLTRFLLAAVGVEAMGSWVQLLQVTTFLGLLDLGVLALMPRDIAVTFGNAESATNGPELIGRYIKIVLWQTPLVAIAATVGWWLATSAEPTIAVPLSIVLVGFTLLFPFRIGPAILSGLQDMRFVGIAQLVGYSVGTVATIAFAVNGYGLYSLAIGWITNQVAIVVLAWFRILSRHKSLLPNRLPVLKWEIVRAMLTTGCWASLSTSGNVLTSNLDVLAIGRYQEPIEVLRYAFSVKLVMMLASQVTVLCTMVLPGMSDLRSAGDEARTMRVLTAYTQLVLLFSGWFGCLLLMSNTSFIGLWVGDDLNFVFPITTILVLIMILRHWQNSLSVGMFLYHREKVLWMATFAEGLVNAIAMLILASFGAKWVCFAGLFGTVLVFVPTALTSLHRSGHWSLIQQFHATAWWLLRLIPLAGLVILSHQFWRPSTVLQLCLASVLISCLYAIVMLPTANKHELGAYIIPYLTASKRLIRVVLNRKLHAHNSHNTPE